MSDIAQTIAELNAKRDAAAARRQQRADEEAEALALASAERGLRDEEALEAAEREHGARRVRTVQTELGMIIVRRPHMNTFRKFQDKGTLDHATIEALIRPCVVHPPLAEFERLCAELPAVPVLVANAVSALAGIRSEDLAGK